jgi:hypothetical protein
MSNCALGPDGELKDASKIIWYHDADDDTPIIPPPAILSDSGSPPAKDALSVLMQGGRQLVSSGAPSRRSTRTSKPSARLQAADNACNPPSSSSVRMRKRALSSAEDTPVKRVAMRAPSAPSNDIEEEVPSEPVAEVDGSSVDEYDEDEDVEEAYAKTKVLGDTDRQVCLFHSVNLSTCANLHCNFNFEGPPNI